MDVPIGILVMASDYPRMLSIVVSCPTVVATVSASVTSVMAKFHYADFPVTSATSPRQTHVVPFSPNSITATSPKLRSFGKVAVMEFGLCHASERPFFRLSVGRSSDVEIIGR